MTLDEKSLKEIIVEEYKRCVISPTYFMKKYCIIQHPVRGKIYFNLYPFQENILEAFKGFRYNIILKSRQLGLSTLVAGYSLWLMLFHSDKSILVIATKQEVAKNLVTKVRVMYQNLPSWLKVSVIEDNKLSLKFNNGSNIKAISAADDSGRSEALSLLVLDECAFIENVEKIWASAQQTIATGGSAILLSTPNGVGNLFHKVWVGALNGENEFNSIELKWNVHPERNQTWRDEQTKVLGDRMAAQECDADFISSGMSVIPGETIKWYEDTFVKDPVDKTGFDRNLWIWEYPDYSKSYIVAADVARGDGSDYSTAQVIDVETVTQVAEYKGLIGTKDFGNFLVNLATQYNDALLIVENSNVGWAVLQQCVERGYKNLFYSPKDMKFADINTELKKSIDLKDKSKLIPGFTTSVSTRPLIISKLDEYVRHRELKIYSKRFTGELWTFIWNGSKPEHMAGYNDDLIIGMAIGLWVRDTALRLREYGIELQRKTLSNITNTKIYSTSDFNYMPNNFSKGTQPTEMIVDGRVEKLDWLL